MCQVRSDIAPIYSPANTFIGYTILDSVILINGSVWLVADDPHDFPTLSSIASAPPNSNESPQDAEWQIVTKEQVRQLGSYGPL
jgi:hypothetical protein